MKGRGGYVAYCCERLRDGTEECAKLFDSREDAIKWIEKLANSSYSDNCDFALYQLGARIELVESVEMEEPKPKIKKRIFSVKKQSK